MAGKNVLVLKSTILPKEVGQHHRLMCLTGKKKGDVYYMNGDRVIMGRGEETDIQIFDMKSSREHAEIKKVGNNFIITDLGSQNGVIVNDLQVTQYTLKDGDRVVIGQTVYKYGVVSVDEKKLGMATSQEAGGELDFNAEAPPDEEMVKSRNKRKNLLILVVVGLGAMMFLSGGDEQPKSKKAAAGKADEPKDITEEFASLSKKKRSEEDRDLEEKLRVIFQRGLRESREGNYFRAIAEFNLALILSPQNARASFYLNKTMQILNEEIEQNFIHARRAYDALKYDQALSSYCSIIRLLQNFPDDERYKTAMDNIKETEVKLGLDEGETKCL